MITFTAGEVFEMAVQIERDGARFYKDAAEFAKDDGKALLLRLARMEEDHEHVFDELRDALTDEDNQPISTAGDDEGAQYLRAMVKGKLFQNDVSRETLASMPINEILKVAINLEKDTIIFYQCIKERATASAETARRIGVIIQQEIGHIMDLTKLLESLNENK